MKLQLTLNLVLNVVAVLYEIDKEYITVKHIKLKCYLKAEHSNDYIHK